MEIALTVVHIAISIAMIIIVLLQSGKQAGLGGAISGGGGTDSFYGKNKGRTLDAILNKLTAAAAILFLITSVLLTIYDKAFV